MGRRGSRENSIRSWACESRAIAGLGGEGREREKSISEGILTDNGHTSHVSCNFVQVMRLSHVSILASDMLIRVGSLGSALEIR